MMNVIFHLIDGLYSWRCHMRDRMFCNCNCLPPQDDLEIPPEPVFDDSFSDSSPDASPDASPDSSPDSSLIESFVETSSIRLRNNGICMKQSMTDDSLLENHFHSATKKRRLSN